MFFHIDESGNTGNNLFDPNQPRLSYGLLSSLRNADVLCESLHRRVQNVIGSDLIHANVLGIGGLTEVSRYLLQIQQKMCFDFDYYFVEKKTYALVSFFEAVFDAGLNEAVKWEAYWTPMRFVLIHKLAVLFDEPLLTRSWDLCTTKRIEERADDIVQRLSDVKARAERSPLDTRSIEIMADALNFGISRPLSLDFGNPDPRMVSPNAVGFQFVVSAIARRVRKKRRKTASSILIDRQSQFNKTQIQTHHILSRFAEGIKATPDGEKPAYLHHPMFVTLDEADIVHKDLPATALTVSSSTESIGLQIVDVYLWLANRFLDGTELSAELAELWSSFAGRSLIDGISVDGMKQRYLSFEQMLPEYDELTEEKLRMAGASVDKHRKKVKSLDL